MKQHADSYRAIARQINPQPGRILFLSDVMAELDAARAAGMQTMLLARAEDGHVDMPANGTHRCVRSFADIELHD